VVFPRTAEAACVQRELCWTLLHSAIQPRSRVLVTLLVLASIVGRVSGQGQADDQRIVRGTVINAVTHEAIGRALVYSPDNRFATLTDSEGHFEFRLPKVGTDPQRGSVSFGRRDGSPDWLMARKPGFLDDQNHGTQIPASPGRELTISLLPEALIKGRIVLSGNDSAIGIDVQLVSRQVLEGIPHWQLASTVQTNSNGEFRFAELLPGTYKLVTRELLDNDPATTVPGGQLYGFPPIYYPGVADFAVGSTIQLAAGQTFQADLSLERQPYYPVRIPVAGADPSSGINVNVSVDGHPGPGYSLGYNAEKQRIEGLLPNGNYFVEALTSGPNAATGTVNIAVAGAPVERPSMVLTRNPSIPVNVAEEFTSTNWQGLGSASNGRRTFRVHGPRLYLQVMVEPVDDFEQQGRATIRPPTGPGDESLVLENLSPGRYWLRLSSSRGYVAAATMGGVDLLHQPLVVMSGSSTPIEITMRDDGAELEGTLAGIKSAFVYCIPLPDSPGQFQQLWAYPDGKFNSPMIAPGTYRVLAFNRQQPNLPYRDAEAMRAYDNKGQIIHMVAGQKQNLELQVIPGAE
jgi:hypothetical protein